MKCETCDQEYQTLRTTHLIKSGKVLKQCNYCFLGVPLKDVKSKKKKKVKKDELETEVEAAE